MHCPKAELAQMWDECPVSRCPVPGTLPATALDTGTSKLSETSKERENFKLKKSHNKRHIPWSHFSRVCSEASSVSPKRPRDCEVSLNPSLRFRRERTLLCPPGKLEGCPICALRPKDSLYSQSTDIMKASSWYKHGSLLFPHYPSLMCQHKFIPPSPSAAFPLGL